MSARPILLIARHTFQEALQKKIVHAVVVLGVAFLILFGIGFTLLHRHVMNSPAAAVNQVLQITNLLLLLGLYVVNTLSVVLAILFSVDTLSGEISSGSLYLDPIDIVVGDFNGDGALDLAAINNACLG